jgi:hypothetical protein
MMALLKVVLLQMFTQSHAHHREALPVCRSARARVIPRVIACIEYPSMIRKILTHVRSTPAGDEWTIHSDRRVLTCTRLFETPQKFESGVSYWCNHYI